MRTGTALATLAVAWLWAAAPAWAAQVQNQPSRYDIQARGGTMRVVREPLGPGSPADQAVACFAYDSPDRGGRTYVFRLNFSDRFMFFDPNQGGKCVDLENGMDVVTSEVASPPSETPAATRGENEWRIELPKPVERYVALYRGPEIAQKNLLFSGMIDYWPGYRTTLTWHQAP